MARNIDINGLEFFLINSPLNLISLAVNIFLLFCLAKPPGNKKRLKQPLKILLEFIMWLSIFYSVILLLAVVMGKHSSTAQYAMWLTMQFVVQKSMSFYVCLDFYFFLHIVPVRCNLLIWLKRNIKVAIFMAGLFGLAILLNNWIVGLVVFLTVGSSLFPVPTNHNVTRTETQVNSPLKLLLNGSSFIALGYIFTLICIKIITSCSTFRYLRGHLTNAAKNGIAIPTARLRIHLWLTVTGISQCVVFWFWASYYYVDYFIIVLSPTFYMGPYISYTITTVYTLGTTINLSIGQSTFRQRIVTLWRALKSMCSACRETNDLVVSSD